MNLEPAPSAHDTHTPALAAFRADLPRKAPNARSLAASIDNPSCTARRVLDAAGVDKAALARQLGVSNRQEESIFAANRGTRFEKDVKTNDYAALVELLRELGFALDTPRILRLRDKYPMTPRNPDAALKARAEETRSALRDMASGGPLAFNLIDGGALEWDFGGALARLETDGIAWRLGGQIRVIEIKSFPIVDGRADPEKVGAAAWQAAVYVAAIADELEKQGFDADRVSSSVLLVCPRNTSLIPTVATVDVARQTRALRRLLAGRADVSKLVRDRIGPEVTLDTTGLDDAAAAAHVEEVLTKLGTNYVPSCLESCPLAFHCRDRARAAGEPGIVGVDARASLAGVFSLPRAIELSAGATPEPHEAETAASLTRARRLLRVLGAA